MAWATWIVVSLPVPAKIRARTLDARISDMSTPTDQTLAALLAHIEPGKVWRSIFDDRGQLLAAGYGDPHDGLGQIRGLDFRDKTVADLGCNLGHYSQLALAHGARLVNGYERDARLCQGAILYAKARGYDNVRFLRRDFVASPPLRQYDMVMLIDFIGKQTVSQGRLPRVLDALERFSRKEIVLTIRPRYRVVKDLRTTQAALDALHGPGYVRGGHFFVLRYVVQYLAPAWRALPLPHPLGVEAKIPIRFVSAQSPRAQRAR